jgi:SAM-dependent methyltransferase
MSAFYDFGLDNPYENFDYRKIPLDLQGWGSRDPNFLELIDKYRPKLIIEVGSWKGGSAVFMAEHIKKRGIDCKIICIDTWLGAIEFYADKNDPERYKSLKMVNGYPTVYYQFLANVMHLGLEDYIIPFPQTSTLAARFLASKGLMADMIYIDASHDEKDVYDDIGNYWELLKNGGVIFGDDYDEFWPGIRLAVNNFAVDNNLEVKFSPRQWMIAKMSSAPINKESANVFQRARDIKKMALEMERELFLLRANFFSQEAEIKQLSIENARLVQSERNLLGQIHAIHESNSWKVTKPLRFLRRLFE